MSTVYLCSATNSTLFTTCCDVAIDDRSAVCPKCRGEVTPVGASARWQSAYDPIKRGSRGYGNHVPNDRRKREGKS